MSPTSQPQPNSGGRGATRYSGRVLARTVARAVLIALIAAALPALLLHARTAAAKTANAQRVEQIRGIDQSAEFVSPFHTEACGFVVTVAIQMTADVTLFFNEDDLIVKEIDRSPAMRVTFSGNNNSFAFTVPAVGVWTYPQGASIGAPAIGAVTGAPTATRLASAQPRATGS
jgi:hypothetical protein